jgi:hypothetical protein
VLLAAVALGREVEVFDDDALGAVTLGHCDELADGSPQAAIAGQRGEPGQLEGDGDRPADRVPRGVHYDSGDVAGVEVDRHHGV